MIVQIEKNIYDFLEKKTQEKGINLFRGFLPKQSHEDRENGQKTNDLFPFVLIRVTQFSQTRKGIDSYEVPVDMELWIGTKEEKEEDYLKNLEIGDWIRKELLEESTQQNSFSIDEGEGFTVDFYSDQAEPYYYSRCQFQLKGSSVESIVANKKMNELLGRS